MSEAGPSQTTSPVSGEEPETFEQLMSSPKTKHLGAVYVNGGGEKWSPVATALFDDVLKRSLDFLLVRTKDALTTYALTARHTDGGLEMSLLRDQKVVPVRERVTRLCNAMAMLFHRAVALPSDSNVSAVLFRYKKFVKSPITFTIESDVIVKETETRGDGLFTTRTLKTGTHIAMYACPAPVYLWGNADGSVLVIGSVCGRLFEALLRNAYRYSLQVATADESLFVDIWSGFSRDRNLRHWNKLQKQDAQSMFFSPAFVTHLNLLLLSRAFPGAGFEDPTTRDDCLFKGPFWDYLLRTEIFPLVCRCLGCVVIPCKSSGGTLVCPSDNLANFVNHANVGEKNNTRYHINKTSLAVDVFTSKSVKAGAQLLADYGNEHTDKRADEPSLTSTCEFLRTFSAADKRALLVLFFAMEKSTIIAVDERWAAALKKALTVVPNRRRVVVREKHPLQNTLILVYHLGEWWPAAITWMGKKKCNLQILRTDLSLPHLDHFGERWTDFELGENITEYMQQGGHSPQTAEAHFSDAIMSKNPWCTLRSACDSNETIPEKLTDEHMKKLPNLPHERTKERSAKERKKKKKSSRGHMAWQNRTWRPCLRSSLYKVKARIRAEVKENWPYRKQLREVSKIFHDEKWDLNGLLAIPLENDPNIRHFEATLETFAVHVPYYYKHEATWMKVKKLETKGASILVSVETLTGDLSHFSYKTIGALRDDFESLYDKHEIVLCSERNIPSDLYALLYQRGQGQFDAEAAVAAGAGAVPSMLLGQIEYLQQQIDVLEEKRAPAAASKQSRQRSPVKFKIGQRRGVTIPVLFRDFLRIDVCMGTKPDTPKQARYLVSALESKYSIAELKSEKICKVHKDGLWMIDHRIVSDYVQLIQHQISDLVKNRHLSFDDICDIYNKTTSFLEDVRDARAQRDLESASVSVPVSPAPAPSGSSGSSGSASVPVSEHEKELEKLREQLRKERKKNNTSLSRWHTNEYVNGKFVCHVPDCADPLSTISSLQDHVLETHGLKALLLKKNEGVEFTSAELAKYNMLTSRHSNDGKPLFSADYDPYNFKCFKCAHGFMQGFKKKSKLLDHWKEHGGDEPTEADLAKCHFARPRPRQLESALEQQALLAKMKENIRIKDRRIEELQKRDTLTRKLNLIRFDPREKDKIILIADKKIRELTANIKDIKDVSCEVLIECNRILSNALKIMKAKIKKGLEQAAAESAGSGPAPSSSVSFPAPSPPSHQPIPTHRTDHATQREDPFERPSSPLTLPPSDEEEASEILMVLGETKETPEIDAFNRNASIVKLRFHKLSEKHARTWKHPTVVAAFVNKWHGRGNALVVVLGDGRRLTLKHGFTVETSKAISPENIASPQWRGPTGKLKNLLWTKTGEPFRGRKEQRLRVSQASPTSVKISRTPVSVMYGFREVATSRVGIYITSQTLLEYEDREGNVNSVPIWKNKKGGALDKSVHVIGIDLQSLMPLPDGPPTKRRRLRI